MTKIIYDALAAAGIDAYFSGQKTTTCDSNYVVILDLAQIGQDGGNKIGGQIINIILYVPKSSYIEIYDFKDEVKAVMATTPVRFTGYESPVLEEVEIEAYSMALEYAILRKF